MKQPKDIRLRHILEIGLLAFGVRLIIDAVFFLKYGRHAVNHLELWLYYGVAEGSHVTAGGLNDPTVWLLRLLGLFLTGDALFYALLSLAALLTALTAVIIYLLVSEYVGELPARYAGLIYAFMVEPLTLSVAGFTHDLLLTPLSLMILLLTAKAVKEKRVVFRLAYALTALLALYLGSRIHIGVYVAAGAAAVYLATRYVSKHSKYLLHYSGLLLAGFILVGFCVLPAFMDYELGRLPQGRIGSSDVKPVSLGNLWLRYNMLLLLLPWGIIGAYKRGEYVGLTYVFLGFVFALLMDRGTRLSDIGVAMLIAYALFDWKREWRRPLTYYCIPFIAVGLVFIRLPIEHRLLTAGAALLLAHMLGQKKTDKKRVLGLILVTGFFLTLTTLLLGGEKIVSEAEYRLYSEDLRRLEGQRVLAPWDRGFMLEVLSGKKAVSSPAYINYQAHEALWLTERQAAEVLKKLRVDYIVFSNRDFNLVGVNGLTYYLLQGGLVFTPWDKPPIHVAQYITAYKLRHGLEDERYFSKVVQVTDERSDVTYTVYKVGDVEGDGGTLSLIAVNHGQYYESGTVDVTLTMRRGREQVKGGKSSLSSYFNPMMHQNCFLKALIIMSIMALTYSFIVLVKAKGADAARWKNYAVATVVFLAICLASYYITSGRQDMPLNHSEASEMEMIQLTYPLVVQPNTMSESHLSLGDYKGILNCSVALKSERPWGYIGSVTFKGRCDLVDETVKLVLLDSTMNMAEDEKEVKVRLKKGESVTIGYSFERKHPYHSYAIAYGKSRCIKVDDERSSHATPEGVEVYHVFCPREHPGARLF
jgi:hypothetical protein